MSRRPACETCGRPVLSQAEKFCASCGAAIPDELRSQVSTSYWERSRGNKAVVLLLAGLLVLLMFELTNPFRRSPGNLATTGLLLGGVVGALLATRRKWILFFLGVVLMVPIFMLLVFVRVRVGF